MRTVKDPDTRKQEILSGALLVFARKGYDKTTISDIARELGISQGLCYRYYASKEEIYDAAVEEYADIIVRANLKRFDSKGKTLKEKIRSFSGSLKEYREPLHHLPGRYHRQGRCHQLVYPLPRRSRGGRRSR